MSKHIIAIGASTGGPDAIKRLLSGLPRTCPPILITQHMLPKQLAMFARLLNRLPSIEVSIAERGARPLPGRAFIAPGDAHLQLQRDAQGEYVIALDHAPPVNRYLPSVDAMFASVATSAGKHAIGVLLTGMGEDGAAGLLAMRHSGALTLAQDAASSVVFGMPGAAVRLGAATEIVPLARMADRLLRAANAAALVERSPAFNSAARNMILANS